MFATIQEHHVRKIRTLLKDDPSVADATVDWVGRLWRFGKEHVDYFGLPANRLGANPATEVAAIHTEHTQHKAWPAELCAAFERLDNPRMVRAYFLLRYTGQRRSDVVKMQRSHFDGSAVEVVQEKTGTYCWIPAHRRLIEHFNTVGLFGEHLLSTLNGRAYRATSLTNMICTACAGLGFPVLAPRLATPRGGGSGRGRVFAPRDLSILGH